MISFRTNGARFATFYFLLFIFYFIKKQNDRKDNRRSGYVRD